jgi:hypothetical protein
MKRFVGIFGVGLAVCCVLCSGTVAEASVVMTDGNSLATIDPTVSANMNSWVVDGVSELYEQSFWVRKGATGGEVPLNSSSFTALVQQFTPNLLKVTYTGANAYAGLNIEVTYDLTGGSLGSHKSDMGESIKILNTTRSSMDVHFFQYVDFDLNGTPGGDSLAFADDGNSVRQSEAGSTLSETVLTPRPGHHEGDYYNNTLSKLMDGLPTTLSDVNNVSHPGDATWAFEWDPTVAANGSFLISKDKRLDAEVPEPATMIVWLLLGAASCLGMRVWRRA